MVSLQKSFHTINHPHEALLNCGNGWGGGEYLNAEQCRELAAWLLEMADILDEDRLRDEAK